MPTYVYRCQVCGAVIERRQSFSDAPLTVCEACGGELRKVLQPVGVIFKGSGFYSTDYRNGSSKATETKTTSDGQATESSSSTRSSSDSSSSNTAASSASTSKAD